MDEPGTYALYAWGNFLYETALDRDPGWLHPEVLSGARIYERDALAISDESSLRVDGSRTLFTVDGHDFVPGRDLGVPGEGWRAYYLRLATDGTREDALALADRIESEGDWLRDDHPDDNPLPVGDVVAVWEEDYGQWDMALIRF